MTELINPYNDLPGYNCFGCAGENPIGLRLKFFEDGDDVISFWEPDINFQGYFNVLHGGIQSTLLDEIASWVVFVKLKTGGVTSRLDVKFKNPVNVLDGNIKMVARLEKSIRNMAFIDCFLYDGKGQLGSSAKAVYYTYSEDVAREKLDYPGIEAFYKTL